MTSGAVLEGWGSPLQTKSAGLPGIMRQRVGLPLKIFQLNSLLLLLHTREDQRHLCSNCCAASDEGGPLQQL